MQAQFSVSWRFSHFRLVSASSLLNASCSFLSAWSFLEGFSDRYLRIFGNSAQRLMVCLPLSRRSLMQATTHLLTSATLSKWSNQLYQLSSLDKASGTKTGLRDTIIGTDCRNTVGFCNGSLSLRGIVCSVC